MMASSFRYPSFICVALLLASAACSRQESAPVADAGRSADAGETRAADLPAGPRLFVSDEVGGALVVIDVSSARVIATIPVGKRPRGLVLSPDKSTLYVALSGTPIGGPNVDESTLPPADKKADGIGVVSVKDLRLLRVVKGGSDPETVAVSRDGTRLFVANEDTGQASAIDPADGRLIGTVDVGGEPEGVNLRPDGGVVYVTSEEDNQVAVIDVNTVKPVAIIPVGPRPRSTAFLPDSSRAYVPAENAGTVTVIDAQKHRVLETIKLQGKELVRPMGTAVSPDGRYLYVTTGRGQHLVIVDTATNGQIAAIEAGARPWGVAVSDDGTLAFTANGTSQDVSIIDVGSRQVRAKIKAGERPWGIVYVP